MSEENMADKENIESIWNKEATACAEQEFWKNTEEEEEDENVRNGRVKVFRYLFLPSLVLGLTCTLLLYGNYSSITMPLFIISCIAYCCHIMKNAAIGKLIRLIGDFSLQYILTPKGTISLKVYNQSNDRYFTRSSLNTQGLGVIMKKDFNGLRDLFSTKKKKSRKK